VNRKIDRTKTLHTNRAQKVERIKFNIKHLQKSIQLYPAATIKITKEPQAIKQLRLSHISSVTFSSFVAFSETIVFRN